MKAPRAIIFDYAGVLSQHQSAGDIARLEAASGIAGARFTEIYWEARAPYDRGVLDGPGYWCAFARRAGRSFSAAQIDALIDADTQSWVRLDEEMVRWLEALQAAGVKTAILSNMGVDLRMYTEHQFAWLARCDARTFSCDVGAIKPEATIYRRCLDQLGIAPSEALFIDDRQDNVEAAEALGLTGLRFESAGALSSRIPASWGIPGVHRDSP